MKYLALVSLLFLSACGGSYALNNQFQNRFKQEVAAWENAQKAFPERCSKGDKKFPPARDKVVSLTKCNTELTNEMVMPVALYPDLVMDMRATALRNAGLYAKGKISGEEWEARGQEAFSNYLKSVDQRYFTAMNSSIQRDQIAAQNTQNALQNMANVNALQNQSNSNMNSTPVAPPLGYQGPKTVRCYQIGNGTTCREF